MMPTNAELVKQVKALKAEVETWQGLAEGATGCDLATTTIIFHDADGNPYLWNAGQPHRLVLSRFPEALPTYPGEFSDAPTDLTLTLDGVAVATHRFVHYIELSKAGTLDDWKKVT